MARVIWKYRDLRFVVGIAILAASLGSASAQQLAARADLLQRPDTAPKTSIKSGTKTAAAAPSSPLTASDAKPARRSAVKGPYYVDFRARTAASYGHAFVWYGKTSERAVEVAGLHPAGDTLPYILGHLCLCLLKRTRATATLMSNI